MQTGMSRGSLWQRHKKMTWMFVFSLLGVSCVIFIIYAYKSGLEWTGFNASQGPDTQQYQPTKTLWDWLQLLIVPIVLSVAASWLNHQNSQLEQRMTIERDKTEHDIALDNQRAELLQGYLDRMSDLLLEQKFNDPQLHLEAQNIARARTLTVLVGLDGERKGRLVQFLYESGLITAGTENCISLQHADLRDADLRGLDLSKANLNEANLSRAQLSEINLSEAQLQNIDLREADLNGAILRHTNLYKAKLNEAILNDAFLQEANLTEAILSEARLERADLTRADFSDAIVNGAKLEGAIYDNKIFSNVQLSKIWKPYQRYFLPSDLVIWTIQADNRSTTLDAQALGHLLQKLDDKTQEQFISKMVFVLTKVDTLLPVPWVMTYNNRSIWFSPQKETRDLIEQKQEFFQEQLIEPFGSHIVSLTHNDVANFSLGEPFSFDEKQIRYHGLLTKKRIEGYLKDNPKYKNVFDRLYDNYLPVPCSARFKYNLYQLMLVILNKIDSKAAQNFKRIVDPNLLKNMSLDEARCLCNLLIWNTPDSRKIFDLEDGKFPDPQRDSVFYKKAAEQHTGFFKGFLGLRKQQKPGRL